MFGNARQGKDGLRGRCKMCESQIAAQRYAAKVGNIINRPVLFSWQPKPGEIFVAYLGRAWCELNPFVCESNNEAEVICTNLDGRWRLDKAEFIFLRPD